MPDKSPRHATAKKPRQPIKQKRAAKKRRLEQAAPLDTAAALRHR